MKIESPADEAYRLKIFEDNLKEIEAHNAKTDQSYKMGVNRFTGYTQKEFEEIFISPIKQASLFVDGEVPVVGLNVDWVGYGAVSPVKNQGTCQATYAFSAIGGIEGISYIYFKAQTEYSVQQLIDCSQAYGNSGCNSGTMTSSFEFIKAKGTYWHILGITTEGAYPFVAKLGTCRTSAGPFKIQGYANITSCTAMESALTGRPLSVAVDGTNFKSYISGIFDNCNFNVGLAALLVGGTDQFYRIKLSWGASFGESGYMRLTRVSNICGICQYVSYPIPQVWLSSTILWIEFMYWSKVVESYLWVGVSIKEGPSSE